MALDIRNPVLQSYIEGVGIKNQREAAVAAQKQTEVENTQRDKQLALQQSAQDEAHQQHLDIIEQEKTRQKLQSAKDDAQHALDLHGVLQQVIQARASGLPTPGLKVNEPDPAVVATYSGMEKPKTTGSIPSLGINDIDISDTDPTEVATRLADIERIRSAPKNEQAQALLDSKNETTKAVAEGKSNAAAAVKNTELNAKLAAQREKSKADFDKEMSVQALRNSGSLAVANVRAAAGEKRIKDAQVKLSGADKDKLQSIADIESNLTAAKALLDKDGYSYFQGPLAGSIEAGKALFNGEPTPEWSNIKNYLGAARQAFVTAEQGKTLSQSEVNLVSSFLVDSSHTLNPQDSKTAVENLLQRLQAMRGSVYANYSGTPQNNGVAPKPKSSIKILSVEPK